MYIGKFTKYTNVYRYIYIYVRVCVCVYVCSRVRKAPYQALLQSFVGGASRTLFLIIYDLQSLPSNQMAIASQMAADPVNLFPLAP